MATGAIRIDDARARRMLREARRKSADLRVPFGVLNKGIERFFMQQFQTAGARGGERWAPLALSTRRKRIRRGANRGGLDRPLWDTGRLRRSLVKESGESVKRVERLEYERGTMVPYAAAHQTGTRRIPRRPLIPARMPRIWGRQAAELIAKHIASADG